MSQISTHFNLFPSPQNHQCQVDLQSPYVLDLLTLEEGRGREIAKEEGWFSNWYFSPAKSTRANRMCDVFLRNIFIPDCDDNNRASFLLATCNEHLQAKFKHTKWRSYVMRHIRLSVCQKRHNSKIAQRVLLIFASWKKPELQESRGTILRNISC